MTRLEKIRYALEIGVKYDPVSGKIYGKRGFELKARKDIPYIKITIIKDNIKLYLMGHQFAYYCVYGKIVDMIDHINGKKDDNRICNLREADPTLNSRNTHKSNGYCFHKRDGKW